MREYTDFGHFVKQEREKHSWTQTEFGAKIGVNSSAISRIENGSQNLSTTKLNKLSELFSIDIQYIKDLFFADKFAKEACANMCTSNVFAVASKTAEHLVSKNSKQPK